ncbi:hypothetical protein LTR49_027514 [Elasticomyces elasticus]|nr:hypothetical protein LTR49_027514 [Elasticomyces elasticus]
MVCIGSGSDPGCGDAACEDSAATPANDVENASTLEGFGVRDVDEATAAPTGCVIGELDAAHAIEAVCHGSALGEGVFNGSGRAVTAGCIAKRGAGYDSAGAATVTLLHDSGLGDADGGLPAGSSSM